MLGADFPVSDLKYRQVDAFMLHLSNKGLKEKTIREYKAAGSQMLDFAVNHEYAGKNPFEQARSSIARPHRAPVGRGRS